ncbi:MAG: universal stress protein [Ktedonobacterales bacterium]
MGDERSREPERATPDELLARYHLRDAPAGDVAAPLAGSDTSGGAAGTRRPGHLRLYLGMAAGVGKTFAMLNEGRRRKTRGADVVIGYVETHGRALTQQQIGDLEIIPRQRITYRDITLEEMDVAAILKRRPGVVLVDELAHTNVPGARNKKRYQDVRELLAAGINVISTLNIQHLEGLNDIVETITGVRQRETLPDQVLDEADEVELVDISPEALRARLRHGNVYPPERATQALDNYFSESNLAALRELALRRTAEKAESQLEQLMRGSGSERARSWAATPTEKVLVAFDGRPQARQLLRDGWRLARALKAPLLAVAAPSPRRRQWWGASRVPDDDAQRLNEHIRLAEDLGAEVILLAGRPASAEALAAIVRERHITQIVIGQPARAQWFGRLGAGSVVDRLLQLTSGADIHVVPDRQHTPA